MMVHAGAKMAPFFAATDIRLIVPRATPKTRAASVCLRPFSTASTTRLRKSSWPAADNERASCLSMPNTLTHYFLDVIYIVLRLVKPEIALSRSGAATKILLAAAACNSEPGLHSHALPHPGRHDLLFWRFRR